jgi:hypothetical protein
VAIALRRGTCEGSDKGAKLQPGSPGNVQEKAIGITSEKRRAQWESITSRSCFRHSAPPDHSVDLARRPPCSGFVCVVRGTVAGSGGHPPVPQPVRVPCGQPICPPHTIPRGSVRVSLCWPSDCPYGDTRARWYCRNIRLAVLSASPLGNATFAAWEVRAHTGDFHNWRAIRDQVKSVFILTRLSLEIARVLACERCSGLA